MQGIDEAALLRALGINTDEVQAGTVKVAFIQGGVVLQYGVMRQVDASEFAAAVTAGAGGGDK